MEGGILHDHAHKYKTVGEFKRNSSSAKIIIKFRDNYNSFSAKVEDGKILLTPIKKDRVKNLEELFKDFDVDRYFSEKDVDNLEMDWGKPQGLEKIW